MKMEEHQETEVLHAPPMSAIGRSMDSNASMDAFLEALAIGVPTPTTSSKEAVSTTTSTTNSMVATNSGISDPPLGDTSTAETKEQQLMKELALSAVGINGNNQHHSGNPPSMFINSIPISGITSSSLGAGGATIEQLVNNNSNNNNNSRAGAPGPGGSTSPELLASARSKAGSVVKSPTDQRASSAIAQLDSLVKVDHDNINRSGGQVVQGRTSTTMLKTNGGASNKTSKRASPASSAASSKRGVGKNPYRDAAEDVVPRAEGGVTSSSGGLPADSTGKAAGPTLGSNTLATVAEDSTSTTATANTNNTSMKVINEGANGSGTSNHASTSSAVKNLAALHLTQAMASKSSSASSSKSNHENKRLKGFTESGSSSSSDAGQPRLAADFFQVNQKLLDSAPANISIELRNALADMDALSSREQKRRLRDMIQKREKGELLRAALQPIVMHATRTNAGVVGINNEITSFTDKKGNVRYIGRIKSYAKDKGNNSYGFVECPEIQKEYGGDAFLRKDQYLDCFEVGDKVSFLLDLSKEGKPQAIELMPPDGKETPVWLDSLRRRDEEYSSNNMRPGGWGRPHFRNESPAGLKRGKEHAYGLPCPDPTYEKRRRFERGGPYMRDAGLYGRDWSDRGWGSTNGGPTNGTGSSVASSSSTLPPPPRVMPNPFGPPVPSGTGTSVGDLTAALLASNPVLQTAALLHAASNLTGAPSPSPTGGGSTATGATGSHSSWGGATQALGYPIGYQSKRTSSDMNGRNQDQLGDALRQLLGGAPSSSSSATLSTHATSASSSSGGALSALLGTNASLSPSMAGHGAGSSGSLGGPGSSSAAMLGLGGVANTAAGVRDQQFLNEIFGAAGLSTSTNQTNVGSTPAAAASSTSLFGDGEFSQEDWTSFLQYLSVDPTTGGPNVLNAGGPNV
ncbi:unnamed protein product [Amoebophrya sp. A25]|nr:unnamed protein product [Amoebophrya sp. A25]|eukprot:GSA25T00010847001.1